MRALPLLALALAGCFGAPPPPFCDGDGACPAGMLCNAPRHQCLAQGACGADRDCVPGHLCDSSSSTCVLSAACSADPGCPGGHLCDATSSSCVPIPAACSSDAECPGGHLCGGAGSCVVSAPCSSDAGCPAGHLCDAVSLICRAQAACSTDADCVRGHLCDTSSSACVADAACAANGDCPGGHGCNVFTAHCDPSSGLHLLSVQVSGDGLVTSAPPGLSCDGGCAVSLPANEGIVLSETPGPDSDFFQFGAPCAAGSPYTSCALPAGEDLEASPAFRVHHLVSGTVSGLSIPGLGVTLHGPEFTEGANVGLDGAWSIKVWDEGAYTVAPAIGTGVWSSAPASRSFTLGAHGDAPGQDFAISGGTTLTGSVSGLLTEGVAIQLTGPALCTPFFSTTVTTTTDSKGVFSFAGLDGQCNYTLSASVDAPYTASPSSLFLQGLGQEFANGPFSFAIRAGANSVGGAVSGLQLGGVPLELTGPIAYTAVTAPDGTFRIDGLPNGDYTLTPALDGGYLFTPPSLAVTLDGGSVLDAGFADDGRYLVSGSIALADGGPLAGVSVVLGDNAFSATETAADGTFTLHAAEGPAALVPALAGYGFFPAQLQLNVAGDVAGQQFSTCTPQPFPSGSRAVAYQIDAAHTGSQPCDLLRLPLAQRWSHAFSDPIMTPLLAGGRVFVLSAGWLSALDETSGALLWGPVQVVEGTVNRGGIAYEGGRVFAQGEFSAKAFDAASGALLWSQTPGVDFQSAPVASGGRVIGSGPDDMGGGLVVAFDEADGGLLWTRHTGGGRGGPAVANGAVYQEGGCAARALRSSSGTVLWESAVPGPYCTWWTGGTVAVARAALYAREPLSSGGAELFILDRRTGAVADPLAVPLIPAFSADSDLYSGADVQAVALDGGVAWTADGGTPLLAPITVGPHVVFATSDGTLQVLDARTGAIVSSVQVPGLADTSPIGQEPVGLAAADGLLLVPAGATLAVY